MNGRSIIYNTYRTYYYVSRNFILFSTDYGTLIKIDRIKSSIICKIFFKLQILLANYEIILKVLEQKETKILNQLEILKIYLKLLKLKST